MQFPRRSFFLLLLAAVGLLCMLTLTGCGRRGREAAKEKIKQAHHAFTADDFVKAAADGDQPLVEAFLQAGMDHNAPDARGLTAVMAAAAAGKADVVKTLLDDNAKADLANKDGKTALHLAAENDQSDAVRALIEANADVRARDHDGIPPLLRAVQAGHERVVAVFLDTSRDQLARDGQIDRGLAVAAILGRTGIIKQFLDKGGNVNATVENKKTPLMLAAEYNHPDVVEFLLSRGADPRLTDKDGASAAVIALQKGFPDLAKTLDAHTPGGKPTTPPPVAAADASPSPPSASPGASPVLAAAGSPTPPPLDPAQAREQAWLKEKGVKPDEVVKRDTGQDDDHDGFTNDEELAAGTDPNDPNSHPPYAAKLRLQRVEGGDFPILFERPANRGNKVTLTVRGKSGVEVEIGEKIPGLPYRVVKWRPRTESEKDTGRMLDVSELTVVNTDTKKSTVLIRGMANKGADARAVLRLSIDGSEVTVKQGDEFALPRDPATRYQVVDLRPAQVVLKIIGTGQTVTVDK